MELDRFNHLLQKASQDRFELRISKNNITYLYDYDDKEQAIIRNKVEIKDIIDCQYLEDFCYNNEEKEQLGKFRRNYNV